MPLMFKDNKLLFAGGALATSEDCCCESDACCQDALPSSITLTFPDVYWNNPFGMSDVKAADAGTATIVAGGPSSNFIGPDTPLAANPSEQYRWEVHLCTGVTGGGVTIDMMRKQSPTTYLLALRWRADSGVLNGVDCSALASTAIPMVAEGAEYGAATHPHDIDLST